MKKIAIVCLSILMATSALAVGKSGTRAYGMGGAYSAIGDDAAVMFWNPAALTQTKLVGTSINLGVQDYGDLKDIADFAKEVVDLASETNLNEQLDKLEKLDVPKDAEATVNSLVAINLGSIGVGVLAENKASVSGGKEEVTINGIPTGQEVQTGEFKNRLLVQGVVGYGMDIVNLPLPILGGLSLGGNLKGFYVKQDSGEISADNFINDDGQDTLITINSDDAKTGLGADIGALATLTDTDVINAKVALVAKDVVNTLDDEYKDEMTIVAGAGVVFKTPLVDLLSFRLAAEVEKTKDEDAVQHLGLETRVGLFSVRGGAYGTDLAEKEERTITVGAGLNLPLVDLNAAIDDDDYASLSFRFNF